MIRADKIATVSTSVFHRKLGNLSPDLKKEMLHQNLKEHREEISVLLEILEKDKKLVTLYAAFCFAIPSVTIITKKRSYESGKAVRKAIAFIPSLHQFKTIIVESP